MRAIGQRGVQQFVHRLGRLRPQPGEQPCPPAERPQRLGEQRVRARRNRRAPAARRRSPRRHASRGVRAARARSASHSAPGRPTASAIRLSSVRPPSGLVSRQAKVRSSCGSSSASASAIRSCTAGCSVSTSRSRPGHRHAARLQRPHQRARECVAPAHQHQHVAGRQRTPLAFQQHRARGLLPDPVGQRVGQMLRRRALALVVVRHLPGRRRVVGVGQRRQRP